MNAPSEAAPVVSLMRQAIEQFDAVTQARRSVVRLRDELDDVRIKLDPVSAKLNIALDERVRLMRQMTDAEHQERKRLEALQGELESALKSEMSRLMHRNTEELRRRLAMKLQLFDAQRADALEETRDEEFRLRERQLDQLHQEINLQSQEFLTRLAHAGPDAAAAQAIRRDMTDTLARRKAEFETRRNQLGKEHEAFVSAQRSDFIQQVTQQLRVEQQQRERLREAEFRAGMARLLQQTSHEDSDQLDELRQAIDHVTKRHGQLVQSQALWEARLEALNQEREAKRHRVDELEAAQITALAKLEEALEGDVSNDRRNSVFAWFRETMHHLPEELGTELEWIRRRVEVRLTEVQHAEAQQRRIRDRQMALQLSHELEQRYRQARMKQWQEQGVKARKAQELLARAEQLERRGQFDEALKLVSQVQELDPSHAQTVALLRERLLAAREQAVRRAQADQLERMFARAMELFERKRYEEAVSLFQQVVAQEAGVGVEQHFSSRLEAGNR